jgi:hypothetical protein
MVEEVSITRDGADFLSACYGTEELKMESPSFFSSVVFEAA